MTELLKCPFCGRTPIVEDCGTNRWFVRCQCGIAQDKLYHQRCDAVRAWNRRKSVTDVPSAQPERMTNRQWIDFLSVQFDISRTSAKEMLHGMMQWKKEDNFKKMFNGGKT